MLIKADEIPSNFRNTKASFLFHRRFMHVSKSQGSKNKDCCGGQFPSKVLLAEFYDRTLLANLSFDDIFVVFIGKYHTNWPDQHPVKVEESYHDDY